MSGQPYAVNQSVRPATLLPERPEEFRGVAPYLRRLADLERRAAPYRDAWRTLNEFIHPWSGKYLVSEKDQADVFLSANIRNAAVGDAARLCASALHGGLTSPAKPWFELTHPDDGLMEIPAVKSWMHRAQETLRSVLARSNFYSVVSGLYLEAVIYGTAAMIVDPDPATGVRFRQLTIGEYLLGQGEDLRVNSLYRRLDLTASQLREKFGLDNPGYTGRARDAIRRGEGLDDPSFRVIHAMQPAGFFGGRPNKNFNYESVYFLEDAEEPEGREVLAWRGHRSQPFVAVRWAAAADALYGYSPGWAALPDDRLLQAMEEDYAAASEASIRPALTGPSELEPYFRDGGLAPGLYIPFDAASGKGPAVQPVHQINYEFGDIRAKIQDTETRLRSRFYNDLFVSLLFNDKRMTATEIGQRLEEKAMVLGPMLERFQAELFDPVLDRVFVILYFEYGLLPPPPPEIGGSDLKIEYLGTLAQSVRLVGLSNLTNSLPIIRELLSIDPSAAVKINIREAIDEVAIKSNWPPKAIRSDEECQAIEERAAQAEQQKMQMEQLQALARAGKDAAPLLAGEGGGGGEEAAAAGGLEEMLGGLALE
ncbi:MAG: head-tail connector protein [Planctomycetota bacterium]|jgi:hypothetical protein|nr:head-tail connector protein [Planctomycetota bacterium]